MFADGIFVTIMSVIAVMVADRLLPRIGLIIAILTVTIILAYKNFKQLVQLKK